MDTTDTIVYLNVGGALMATFLKTLTKHADSKLAELFTTVLQPRDYRDENSPYFLDRNGAIFSMVVNYLNSDYLEIPRDPSTAIWLRQELAYWKLPAVTKINPFPAPQWISTSKSYHHVHIFSCGDERIIEWGGGKLPDGLSRRPLEQIVKHFGSMGYKITSQFGAKAVQPLTSLWMVKEEAASLVELEAAKKASVAVRSTTSIELKEPPTTSIQKKGTFPQVDRRVSPSDGPPIGPPPIAAKSQRADEKVDGSTVPSK